MDINDNHYQVLRKVRVTKLASQRRLASMLGFSLGKLNYCIKELKKKGLIKIKNFQNNPSKSNYLYLLTPKGFSVYTKLTINFMSRKIIEYEELEKELNKKDVDSN